MADALTNITSLINSPPGQLVAGGVLAGIVWKFFERVEAVLTNDTKLEIAVWLLGVKVGEKVEPWPETFARIFDRVFGEKHLSWKCFFRSCIATLCSCLLCTLFIWEKGEMPGASGFWVVGFAASSFLCLFDYISLLESRYILLLMSRWKSGSAVIALLLLDVVITGATGGFPGYIGVNYAEDQTDMRKQLIIAESKPNWSARITTDLWHDKPFHLSESWPRVYKLEAELQQEENQRAGRRKSALVIFWLPTFLTSIWLWLYAGSGFLLTLAKRFDIGFEWFNRKFDIEHKPLQAIGLVSGAIVAAVYWAAVILKRVL